MEITYLPHGEHHLRVVSNNPDFSVMLFTRYMDCFIGGSRKTAPYLWQNSC